MNHPGAEITADTAAAIDRFLSDSGGIFKLKPNYVRRYYRDGGRLAVEARTNGTAAGKMSSWTPERWIASTVTACNPDTIANEGLSLLDIPESSITFKEALSLHGEHILGAQLATRYAPHFPLLSKVFDPYDPIVFHFHARDEDVRKFPQHFAPNESGKEEAYYFLTAPKGRMPYTHVGLHPGVPSRRAVTRSLTFHPRLRRGSKKVSMFLLGFPTGRVPLSPWNCSSLPMSTPILTGSPEGRNSHPSRHIPASTALTTRWSLLIGTLR